MSVFSFITQPYRFSVQADTSVRTAYDLARQIEIDSSLTAMADAATVATELFNILKSPRQRFDVPVIGIDFVDIDEFDGLPPCATLMDTRWAWSANLVLQGNGSAGSLTAWQATGAYLGGNNDGILSETGGKLRLVQQTFGAVYSQPFSTVAGAQYRLTGSKPSASAITIGSDKAFGGKLYDIYNSNADPASTSVDKIFTAVDDQTWISIHSQGVNPADFDDLSVKPLGLAKLVVIPDFTIDLNAGQTVLRCWG